MQSTRFLIDSLTEAIESASSGSSLHVLIALGACVLRDLMPLLCEDGRNAIELFDLLLSRMGEKKNTVEKWLMLLSKCCSVRPIGRELLQCYLLTSHYTVGRAGKAHGNWPRASQPLCVTFNGSFI